ncbi:MAG: type IX secretion system protein PorQ, partial [Bacteroidales bacterium]|nr:type IX secretion system protein PorQ [Bacteroidales bacterium]
LIFISVTAFSQSGGDNIYDFLNLTTAARYAALGGQQISIPDNDINGVSFNPALLTNETDRQLAINFIDYFMDVKYATVYFAKNINEKSNLALGLQYVDYGEFTYADESGYRGGKFRANEYALYLSYSRNLLDSSLVVGVNAKPIFSDLENYTSFGLAFDIGATYIFKNRLTSAAVVIKNMGMELKPYYHGKTRENLPFEIQVGISQRLRYAPFRLSLLTTHWEDWSLTYKTDEDIKGNIDPVTGEPKSETALNKFGDNLLSHMIFGLEFIPSETFIISAGYNFKRRAELGIEDRMGMVGMSVGASLNLRKLSISYAHSVYHVAGGSNNFSLRLNLGEFGKKL